MIVQTVVCFSYRISVYKSEDIVPHHPVIYFTSLSMQPVYFAAPVLDGRSAVGKLYYYLCLSM